MILERLIVAIDANIGGLQRGLQGAGVSLRSFNRTAERLKRTLTASAAAATGATVALGEFTSAGGRIIGVSRAFTRRVGDQTEALGLLRRATRGLVSDAELMTQANVALTLGSAGTVKEFATLAETAQSLGRALGIDTAFALNSLNVGIARQSRLILDNVGLIVDQTEANEKYAAALGLTVKQLDDAQRAEAFRLEAMEQARLKVDEMGGVVLNAGDAWDGLKISMTNALDQFKVAAAESGVLQSAFEGLRDTIREMSGGPSGVAQAIIESLATITDPDVLMDRAREFVALMPAQAMGQSFGPGVHPRDLAHDTAMSVDELNAAFQRAGITGEDLQHILAAISAQLRRLQVEAVATSDALGQGPATLAQRLAALGDPSARVFTGQFAGAIGGGVGGGPLRFGGLPPSSRAPLGSERQLADLSRQVQRVAENLRPLTRQAPTVGGGVGLFGGLGDRLGSILDPRQIVSNMVAGFATSGLNFAVGAIGGALANIFGGVDFGAIMEANTRAIRMNTEAILGSVRGTGGGLVGAIIDGLRAGLEVFNQPGGGSGFQAVQTLADIVERAGFAMEDVTELFESLGIELLGTRESFSQFLELMSGQLFRTLSGRLSLARTRIELLDLDDPSSQFAEIRSALAASLPPGLFGPGLGLDVARLTPENIQAFARGIIEQVSAGEFDLAQLGDVSLDAFLAALVQLENLADSAEGASGALGELSRVINAPSGFKVALHRFRATVVGASGGIDATRMIGPRGGDVVFAEGAVQVNVSGTDPNAGVRIVEAMKRAIELEAARGGGDALILGTML